jgi:hypothetical protein
VKGAKIVVRDVFASDSEQKRREMIREIIIRYLVKYVRR